MDKPLVHWSTWVFALLNLAIGGVLGAFLQWHYAEQRYNFDVLSKVAELRGQQNVEYTKLADLAAQYQRALMDKDNAQKNRLGALMKLEGENFTALEGTLAQLEHRAPRAIPTILMAPESPTNLQLHAN